MPLTDLQRVRSLIGDMEKFSLNELLGEGPNGYLQYQTDAFPISTGSFTVLVSGAVRTATATTNQLTIGIIDFTGVSTAVTAGAEVRASYRYFALSNDEIQSVVDMVSGTLGDRVILAASIAARGLAGNYARLFSYSQGQKSVNKDNISDKLLRLADSLMKQYEATIKNSTTMLTITSFDDSGTEFDGFNTAKAAGYSTGTNPYYVP